MANASDAAPRIVGCCDGNHVVGGYAGNKCMQLCCVVTKRVKVLHGNHPAWSNMFVICKLWHEIMDAEMVVRCAWDIVPVVGLMTTMLMPRLALCGPTTSTPSTQISVHLQSRLALRQTCP